MIKFLAIAKGAAGFCFVAMLGGMLGTTFGILADAVGETTPVTLGIVGIVGLGCWQLSAILKGLKDGQREQSKNMEIFNRRLGRIEGQLHLFPWPHKEPKEESSST